MQRKVYNRLLEWKEKDAGSSFIRETRSLSLMRYRDILKQEGLLNI